MSAYVEYGIVAKRSRTLIHETDQKKMWKTWQAPRMTVQEKGVLVLDEIPRFS